MYYVFDKCGHLSDYYYNEETAIKRAAYLEGYYCTKQDADDDEMMQIAAMEHDMQNSFA